MIESSELASARQEMRAAYWDRKDLAETIRVAKDAIERGQKAAGAEDDAERATHLLGLVKGLAYDLGSFTWTGWDEPGIKIDKKSRTVGLDAARLNLELATTLNGGPDKLAAAHWLLGAQLLAAGANDEAVAALAAAADRAEAAGDPGLRLVARGTAAIALADRATLDAVKAELAAMEEGAVYVDQLDTAARVFKL